MIQDADRVFEFADSIVEMLENPLKRDLEVGFRHSPLSTKETLDRYAETCKFAAEDLRWVIDLLRAMDGEPNRR